MYTKNHPNSQQGTPMKRDLELVRTILLEAEQIDPANPHLPASHFENVEPAVLGEHFRLMHEKDLIVAHWISVNSGVIHPQSISRVKNEGHDFLEAIRNDSVWKKTLNKIGGTTGAATLELTKAIALHFLREQLGIGSSE